MNFGENIKQLRISKNLTQAQVAKFLGIKQSSYVSWEQKTSNPTLELIEKLSKLYQLPIDKIIEKNEACLNIEDQLLENFQALNLNQQEQLCDFAEFLLKQSEVQSPKVIQVETYKRSQLNYAIVEDEQLSAGFGQAVSNTGARYKAYTTQRLSRYDGAARINGDSMEPEFKNFSIATFLHTGFDRDGEIYAISEGSLGEEQLYIKQVFREANRFRIHSLNPKYKDFFLGEGDEFQILGPVVDHFVELEEEQIEE